MQYDEKTTIILQQLEQGKTRQEIAQTFNQQWKSIDMHMRRRGFRWDKTTQIYIKQSNATPSTKIQALLQSLATKQPNFKKIAQQHGFRTVEEMGLYMKQQGYIWHPELQNYYYVSTPMQQEQSSSLNETTLMQFLLANQQALTALLTNATIPHTITTNELTITLTSSLYAALLEQCQKRQLTPQAIIEIALGQYLTSTVDKSN
ncbi:hypothetical protein ACIQVU_20120 [Lysinibacillus sp. NPDC098008]|uniref:hypothetical protein n=1 Tax=Lysinibacillus sp. NPDC098008 TaxID=3364146 RepID=UPI0037F64944